MIMSKDVEIYVNNANYEYYTEKGYFIERHIDKDKHIRVKKGTKIIVKIIDLPENSSAKINVKCDYCGDITSKVYSEYLDSRKKIKKDSCYKCARNKTTDINIKEHGTNSIKELSIIKNFQVGRKLKYSYCEINTILEERGIKLVEKNIDKENISVLDKLPFICNKHMSVGIQYRTLDQIFQTNTCCKYGGYEARQNDNMIDLVKDICEERKYILLTKEIYTVDDKVEFICSNHKDYGIQSTSLYGLNNSIDSCRMCTHAKLSNENHWNWQGGIGKERDIIKQTPKYKQWVQSVFKRDDYTCKCCGIRGSKLNAHHLKCFSDYKELRTEISNGITLCENCHSVGIKGSFHNLYGTYHNTEEQLNEYIKLKQSERQQGSLLLCSNL